jgi:hypothetical protein
MRILLRILLLPFISPIYFLFMLVNYFKVMRLFIMYGGTLEINDKEL